MERKSLSFQKKYVMVFSVNMKAVKYMNANVYLAN